MSLALPLFIGIIAGICSGLFGIGGGVVIVPLLLFFYKLPAQGATATSLIALLLPVGALGVWQFYQSGFIQKENVQIGILIAIGILFGTLLGAKISTYLSSQTLTRLFSVFLVLIALKIWFTNSSR